MASDSQRVVSSLQKAKQILFVIHEYLPLPLALWVPAIVAILKDQKKEVTILIAQESLGWLQQVDTVYPNDMVLQLEQLRQEISFPLHGDTVGEVSYSLDNNVLKVTVIPTGEPVDVGHMQSTMQGNSFDYVLGVGISANHEIFAKLTQAASSLTRAEYLFLGTFAAQSALESRLPMPKQVEVIESTTHSWLQQTIVGLSDLSTVSDTTRELLTLFMYSHDKALHTTQYLDKESFEFLGKLFSKPINTKHLSKIFGYDPEKLSQTLEVILASRQFSSSNDTIIFGITTEGKGQHAVSVVEIERALYYLPKYDSIKQVVVVASENEQLHHVWLSGSPLAIKQIATKYGFPMTDQVTCGIVSGISFERLCEDITRIIAKEAMLPQQTHEVHLVEPLTVVDPAPLVSEEQDNGREAIDSEEIPAAAEVVTGNAPVIQTSPGIDFAAIAKKMRESTGQ